MLAHLPPPYSQHFVILFWHAFIKPSIEYDYYMCSETDFTQEIKRIGVGGKVGLLQVLLTACCCSVTKWSNSGIAGS